MCGVYVPLINYNNVQGICVYQYLQSVYRYIHVYYEARVITSNYRCT